jgi:hypothetical protein
MYHWRFQLFHCASKRNCSSFHGEAKVFGTRPQNRGRISRLGGCQRRDRGLCCCFYWSFFCCWLRRGKLSASPAICILEVLVRPIVPVLIGVRRHGPRLIVRLRPRGEGWVPAEGTREPEHVGIWVGMRTLDKGGAVGVVSPRLPRRRKTVEAQKLLVAAPVLWILGLF